MSVAAGIARNEDYEKNLLFTT